MNSYDNLPVKFMILILVVTPFLGNAQNKYLDKTDKAISKYLLEITKSNLLYESLSVNSASVGKVEGAIMSDVVLVYPENKSGKVDFDPKEYNISYDLKFEGQKTEVIFTLNSSLEIVQDLSTKKSLLEKYEKLLSKKFISIDKAIKICSEKYSKFSGWKLLRIEENVMDFAKSSYEKGESVSSFLFKGNCGNCDYTNIRVQISMIDGEVISEYKYR